MSLRSVVTGVVLSVVLASAAASTGSAAAPPPPVDRQDLIFADGFESGDTSAWGPPASTIWHPAPGTSWQWQLSGTIDTSVAVQMYDIDLFDAPQSVIDELRGKGVVVICYFSAGSWEDWRPDKDDFPAEVLGNTLSGWSDERWLDIRQIELLRPQLVLVMGRFAAQSLLHTDAPISALRGRVHRLRGGGREVPAIVSYHPAYLLRNLADKAKAWADLCLALDVARGDGG